MRRKDVETEYKESVMRAAAVYLDKRRADDDPEGVAAMFECFCEILGGDMS